MVVNSYTNRHLCKNHCLLLLSLFVGVSCFVLALLFSTLSPFYFCNHLDGEERERAGCFTLIVFLMSYDYYCSVAIPHSAMD